ncbi:MAG: alpha/beta hydrolase family protein, partial [bacterium]
MRKCCIVTLVACFVITVLLQPNISSASKFEDDISGTWQGALKISGGMELRIVFHISKNEDGSYGAKLDSPDQGAAGIPVGTVIFKDNHLRLDVPVVAGKYEGDLKENSQTIEGEWSQGGMSLPLVLKRVDKVEMPKRPQMPQKPYPYNEEEVSYENTDAGITLAGTLTFPKSGGQFPAIVLITGSGPQDRDESLLGHKPFLVLADHLTRNGIAVLRFDDRGVGKSTGDFTKATSEDFAGDVMAGLTYLINRKEIDSKKIGLVGHSEGGLVAPMVAANSSDVAFIVLMAGPGLQGDEILYLQTELISKANGISKELIARSLIDAENIYAIVKSEDDNAIAEQKLLEYRKKSWEGLSDALKEEAKKFGDPEKMFEASLKQILSPWFRY